MRALHDYVGRFPRVCELQGIITTKLDRKKLNRETTFIQHEDSAGILLNGVNHIYAQNV
jgi:hypothetical protein